MTARKPRKPLTRSTRADLLRYLAVAERDCGLAVAASVEAVEENRKLHSQIVSERERRAEAERAADAKRRETAAEFERAEALNRALGESVAQVEELREALTTAGAKVERAEQRVALFRGAAIAAVRAEDQAIAEREAFRLERDAAREQRDEAAARAERDAHQRLRAQIAEDALRQLRALQPSIESRAWERGRNYHEAEIANQEALARTARDRRWYRRLGRALLGWTNDP